MALKDYRTPTETVTVKGQGGEETFVVRGLSPTAISSLIRSQGESMQRLYVRALTGEFDVSDVETLLDIMLDESPLLVALVIAFGVGEPDAWSNASEMPVSDQVVLLDKIIRLTFEREGGVEKMVEIIKRAVAQAAALNPLKP